MSRPQQAACASRHLSNSLAELLPQAQPNKLMQREVQVATCPLPADIAAALMRPLAHCNASGRLLGFAAWVLTLARCLGVDTVTIGHGSGRSMSRRVVVVSSQETVCQWLERLGSTPSPTEGPTQATWLDEWHQEAAPTAPVVAGFVDGSAVSVRCDGTLFAEAAATSLAETHAHLVAEIVRKPEATVGALAALPAAELARLSQSDRRLNTSFETRPSVPERIEAQASKRPDAVAVSCDDKSLTFCELNRRANQLAWRLRALGVGEGSLVAIGMQRSLDLVVGLLAILKAGAAYLPLDMSYPRDRLEFTLADAAAGVLITDRESAGVLPRHDATVILIDEHWESIAREVDCNLRVVHSPESLAYVIYTSGSTGKPKGCEVTHANVMRLFTATEHWFGFSADDVWTFFHSHAFDFSVWEIWGALIYGGRVVVVPYSVSRAPKVFHALLCRERVTVLNQTPTAFRALIQADLAEPDSTDRLALRTVIFGGEALELQMLRPWFDKHGDRRPRLINMYGITETTVHVTYRPIGLADLEANMGSVIGEPIPDLCIFLLNPRLEPVPVSVTGEIYVAGAGVSRGYLNRAQLSAERFIGWTAPDGRRVRLYKTGDLARWLPNGDMEYLGRADQQVKIRGFRIETGEIESVLMRHPGVQACAVVARTDAEGEARLVAYVVPSRNVPTQTALREHLAADLPSFMLPSAFVMLQQLPMTENGKLDRSALPAPGRRRPDLGLPFEPAQTQTEMLIASTIADCLDLDEVGRLDNFIELGGDSIQAAKVMAQLTAQCSVELPVTLLLTHPTVAALATDVDAAIVSSALWASELAAQIDQLSDDEVERLLAADEAEVQQSVRF